MNATAVQVDTDWTQSGDSFKNETAFDMRPCKPEDFGDTEVASKLYYSWQGFIILCPETTNK